MRTRKYCINHPEIKAYAFKLCKACYHRRRRKRISQARKTEALYGHSGGYRKTADFKAYLAECIKAYKETKVYKDWRIHHSRYKYNQNKAACAEAQKRYYQANKEKAAQIHKAWEEKNREHLRQYAKAYYAKNKEAIKEYQQKYQMEYRKLKAGEVK